jgi:hypothetical protein
VALVNPLTWGQNTGAVNTAQMMRLASGGAIRGDSTLGANLSGRSGVCWRAAGNSMGCAQIGGGTMSLNFNPGLAYVAGTEALSQGGYWVANDANISMGPFATAHATLNRIDLVYIQIRDAFYSTTFNDARVLIQTGVAGAGVPVITGNPPNTLVIAQVTVRAGATSILQSDVLYVAPILTSPGGIAPLWAAHAAVAGNIEGEFSFYNKLLRRWDAAATLWRTYGIPYVANPSTDVINPETNQLAFNTSTRQFNRWTGSAWSLHQPNTIKFFGRQNGAASFGSGAFANIALNLEIKDSGNGHSNVTNPERYVAPRDGCYMVHGTTGWSSGAPTASRGTGYSKNNVSQASDQVFLPVTPGGAMYCPGSTMLLDMNAGDYVTLQGYQNTGGAITITDSKLSVIYLGDD